MFSDFDIPFLDKAASVADQPFVLHHPAPPPEEDDDDDDDDGKPGSGGGNIDPDDDEGVDDEDDDDEDETLWTGALAAVWPRNGDGCATA